MPDLQACVLLLLQGCATELDAMAFLESAPDSRRAVPQFEKQAVKCLYRLYVQRVQRDLPPFHN